MTAATVDGRHTWRKNPIGIYGAIKIKVNKNNIGIDLINWFWDGRGGICTVEFR